MEHTHILNPAFRQNFNNKDREMNQKSKKSKFKMKKKE